jgi:hypothetical protein
VELSHLARSITDFAEAKLIVNYQMSTGRFTFGLSQAERQFALSFCGSTRNPFETHATGGFHYRTAWHASAKASKEWVELNNLLSSSFDSAVSDRIQYFNTFAVSTARDIDMMGLRQSGLKRSRSVTPEPTYHPDDSEDEDQTLLVNQNAKRPRVERILFSQLLDATSATNRSREDVLGPVTDLIADMNERALPDHASDTSLYDDDIMAEFLEYVQDSEEDL